MDYPSLSKTAMGAMGHAAATNGYVNVHYVWSLYTSTS